MTASPPLDLTGFGAAAGIAPTDTLNSVTAAVNGWNSSAGMGPLAYELRDSHGVLIGSGTGTASTSPAHVDTVTFPPPSWSELHWLHLRITADAGTAPSGSQAFVDYASLSVSYLPSGIPFAAPVAVTATAIALAPDASGPAGRVFTDITVLVGPTTADRGPGAQPGSLAAPAVMMPARARPFAPGVSEPGSVTASVT